MPVRQLRAPQIGNTDTQHHPFQMRGPKTKTRWCLKTQEGQADGAAEEGALGGRVGWENCDIKLAGGVEVTN